MNSQKAPPTGAPSVSAVELFSVPGGGNVLELHEFALYGRVTSRFGCLETCFWGRKHT